MRFFSNYSDEKQKKKERDRIAAQLELERHDVIIKAMRQFLDALSPHKAELFEDGFRLRSSIPDSPATSGFEVELVRYHGVHKSAFGWPWIEFRDEKYSNATVKVESTYDEPFRGRYVYYTSYEYTHTTELLDAPVKFILSTAAELAERNKDAILRIQQIQAAVVFQKVLWLVGFGLFVLFIFRWLLF